MIVSRTPFRVSFFGGGTDYPAWFREHGGAVIGTAINKYCHLMVRELPPFFEHKHRIVYSQIELVNRIEAIQHPSVRAVLGERGIFEGLEIQHNGDLPARSGLGSSSSFTVGLLNAIDHLNGLGPSPRALAEEAIRIEQEVIGEKVGNQDQIWAAHGGTCRIDFHPDGAYDIRPVAASPARLAALQGEMMLFFTGLSRIAETVAAKQIDNIGARQAHLHRMRRMVDEAEAILIDPDRGVGDIGDLAHEAWCLKRELADGVSNPTVDRIYERARAAGARGGKLLGAGGGGFMLLYVPRDRQADVRATLTGLTEVSFAFAQHGTRVYSFDLDTAFDLTDAMEDARTGDEMPALRPRGSAGAGLSPVALLSRKSPDPTRR